MSTLLSEPPPPVALTPPRTPRPNEADLLAKRADVITSPEEAIQKANVLSTAFRQEAILRDQQRRLPAQEIEQLTQAGLYGISVPRDFGGAEVPASTLAEVFRIISAADPSIGQIPQNHFCWLPVIALGTAAQQKFFYDRVLKGDRIGNAHSENSRRRPGEYEHDVKRVDEGYLVTGKKYYSTGAIFAQWIPLIAHDPEGRLIMLFAKADAPGLTVVNDWGGMGQRTTASGTTVFEKVFIPDDYVFPFYDFKEDPRAFGPIASLIHTAIDLGIAEEAWADAREYILHRNRPWIENPHDEHAKEPFIIKSFGELTVDLHTAQIVFRHASQQTDAYRAHPTPETRIAARMATADARVVCGRAALRIADQLFELTGARATLEQYDLDRHWRNARTHTLHDPFRWKYHHIGNYALNGILPGGRSYV